MPAPLSNEGSVAYSVLVQGRDMTARLRTIGDEIAEASQSVNALDWSEDLQTLGFELTRENAEAVCKSLGSAFSTVAREVTGEKLAARVAYLADTGEIAVSFRRVKPREK